MDKTFEDYLKDSNITNIIHTVSNKFIKSIDQHDISSISMATLWRCIERYDSTKGTKFTSYLYQQLLYAFKNELKKRKLEFCCDSIEKISDEKTRQEAFDILNSLPQKTKKLLEQRYYDNMTMTEIAEANGYSRETARRRLKNAINACQKMTKTTR
jgi:RNA polymerase sigma factor (sigma-70 family)